MRYTVQEWESSKPLTGVYYHRVNMQQNVTALDNTCNKEHTRSNRKFRSVTLVSHARNAGHRNSEVRAHGKT